VTQIPFERPIERPLASGDVDANGDVVSVLTERLRKAIGDTAPSVDPCEHLKIVRRIVWHATGRT
jgi:hypothetical protein